MSTQGKDLFDPEAFLNGRVNLERIVSGREGRLSLDPMIRLAEKLGHPEKKFRSVHITGTVGKGSTAHFLSVFLRRLGHKVGLYTSPHLERVTERIQVNGAEIPRADFSRIMKRLSVFADDTQASYFDLLTAAAFLYFEEQRVDWAVVEVGIGGRLDSTNIIPSELAIITNIGSDHADVLGKSPADKAKEKGGIIKPGIPVLCGVEDTQALTVIRSICREKKSSLHLVEPLAPERVKILPPGAARYQLENLALAVEALSLLGENHPGFDLDRAFQGDPRELSVPGRFEVFPGSPKIILDGGHMPEAISSLVESLEKTGRRVAVFGAAADKDALGMLKALARWADTVLVTSADTPRAIPVSDLLPLAKKAGLHAIAVPRSREALEKAKTLAQGGTVLVTGSLYLVGELRSLLLQD